MKLGTALAYIFGIVAMATAYTRDGFKSTARPFTIRPKVNRSMSEDSDEKLNAKRDTRSADGFPQELKYVITFDGKSGSELHLVRDHSHVLPPGFQQDFAGRFYRKPITNDLNVAFYKDLNGHGLFACQRQKSALEEFECGFSAMLDIGEETCYIGLGASHADCSAKTDGPFETLLEPIKEITLGNEAVRNKRSILPARGFKIVEVAYLPDAKFTDLFYRRHPGDIAAAEAEMLIFGTLLTNEINMYYSTLKETSNGDLDIQVYPTAVAIPGYKKNFPWSENYNDGTSLSATDDMKENLEYIINDSGFISERFDFVFALTGFNLKDSQTGSPIVSLTYLRTICTNSREKYAVTEFTSWNLPRVLAHELGHALGAEHDDDSSCPSGVNLMSLYLFAPNSTTKDTYYYFSTCSVDDISAHLNSQARCIDDDSTTYKEFVESFCQGFLGEQASSVDKQCQRLTSYTGSTACDSVTEEACYSRNEISCSDSDGECTQKLQYLWNGTPCGTDKVCYKGSCVASFDVCTTTSSTTSSTTTSTPTTTTSTSTTSTTPSTTTTTTTPSTTTSSTSTTPSTTTSTTPSTTTTTTTPSTTTSSTSTTPSTTSTTTTTTPSTTSTTSTTTSTTSTTSSTTSSTSTTSTTPLTTSTTTSSTTSTTSSPIPTTTSRVPCSCCGYKRDKRRKRCCKLGKKKIDATCYCCRSLKDVEEPDGWKGRKF